MKQSSRAAKKSLRKTSKKGASKSRAPKKATANLPIFPLSPLKEGRALKATQRYKRNPEGISRVWGSAEDFEPVSRRRLPRLPNPWPPSDIIELVKLVCSTAGLAGVAYQLIKLWFESRNAKRIRIKKGDYELEIHGWMSKTEIERSITQFRALTKKVDEDEIKVILPSAVDKSLPSERLEKKGRKDDTKGKSQRGKRGPTGGQLKRAGISILSDNPLVLQCGACGAVWGMNARSDGHLPRDFWRCPDGCNRPKVATAFLLN